MNDNDNRQTLERMSVPEIIEEITVLTEKYAAELATLTHELLIRAMQLQADLEEMGR